MRSLVVYQSRHGNTEHVARAVAEGLRERGDVHVLALHDLTPQDLEGAQLVVLGAPTQLHGLPRSVRRLLRRTPDHAWFGRPVAVFDTRRHRKTTWTGSAAAKLGTRMRRMGAIVLLSPESFFVITKKGPLEDGELLRATLWGRQLHLSERVALEGE
jgi:flavodoxin